MEYVSPVAWVGNNKKPMSNTPLSKQLLARPVESRYGVGLSYVGTEGPYVLADDTNGVRYQYLLPRGIDDVPAWYEANHRALVWTIYERNTQRES